MWIGSLGDLLEDLPKPSKCNVYNSVIVLVIDKISLAVSGAIATIVALAHNLGIVVCCPS